MLSPSPESVIVLTDPLPDSDYFPAAETLLAERFWALKPGSIEAMRHPDAFSVISLDETGIMNGIATARHNSDKSTLLTYLATPLLPEREDAPVRNPDLPAPAYQVAFTDVNARLLEAVETTARAHGSTVLKTVGIDTERRWLLEQGFTLDRDDRSHMTKQLASEQS